MCGVYKKTLLIQEIYCLLFIENNYLNNEFINNSINSDFSYLFYLDSEEFKKIKMIWDKVKTLLIQNFVGF